MQLAAMTREEGRVVIPRLAGLVEDDLASIPLVDVEAVAPGESVVTQGAEFPGDGAVVPACEDAPCVRAEGDNVAELLERGEGFIDGDGMALAVAFDGGGEAAET